MVAALMEKLQPQEWTSRDVHVNRQCMDVVLMV
jgi:hypothetical protein